MPRVFAAHPFLTTGATSVDTKGKVVTAGLYLDPNGPHPINSFGCTICHGGQGSGTDFTFSSHTPAVPRRKSTGRSNTAGRRSTTGIIPCCPSSSSSRAASKCHHQITDIPQAAKLQAGYQRIVQYGCTGCHTIGGEGSFGPDLTDERHRGPEPQPHRRQALARVGQEVDQGPPRLPARLADAPVLRPDQQRRQGRHSQGGRRDPGDHPLPVHPEHAARRTSSVPHPRPTPSAARNSSSRRAAWPATSIGPTRPDASSRLIATSSTRTTSPTRR